jgi:hypothetical protein
MLRIAVICVILWLLGSLAYGVVVPSAAHQAQRNAIELTTRDRGR